MTRVHFVKYLTLFFVLALALSACNLSSAPEERIDVTDVPTNFIPPTRTPLVTSGIPTTVNVTPLPLPSTQSQIATSVAVIQTAVPTNTSLPVSIFILSPIPGNVVSGNVQVVGSATHPDFLLYRLEYASDPNPGNIWLPVSGDIQSPVIDGLLGIWNTNAVQDGSYQLRLRVFLRNGAEYGNVIVNNIRVQNTAPTPVPTDTPVIPRPIAIFTQDRLTGNAPLVVRFTNQSQGQISGYAWNFGDGGSSAELNPAHTFNTAGTYTVVLTVSGPGGVSNVSRQINVTTPDAPVASFTQNRTSGTPPLEVAFTSLSTGDIDTLEWDFGDGQTGTGESVTHTFENEGNYNVILRVTGPGGTSTATRQITVENPDIPPPEAAFTQSLTSGDIPLEVQFISQSTGEITGHSWDFGDGTLGSSDQNPLHTFTEPGTYNVRLTVVGPGGQDTAEVTIEAIRPVDAPVAGFTVEGDSTGEAPFQVTFNDTSRGEIDTYLWEFGDRQASNASGQVSHTYTDPGTYTVRLTVSNVSGSSTAETIITVVTPLEPPEALFIANPESGEAPLVVEFTNQSSGDNLTFRWDFGDGETLTTNDSIVRHTFLDAGNYTVQLTATNVDRNLSDSHQVTISVSEPVAQLPDLTANFTFVQSTSDPSTFNLVATATGGTGNYSYAWDFGDGQTASGETTSVTYGSPGSYEITLTVSDDGGSTPATSQRQVTATLSLSGDFTATETSPLVFSVEATAAGGSGNYSYQWEFGDGQVGNGQTTSVTYGTEGTYTITLTLSDSGTGESVVIPKEVTATAPLSPLSGDFTATETSPLVFSVQATASGATGNYAYGWDFGDGQVGNGQNAAVTYGAGGTYTITLTLSDSGTGESVVIPKEVTATTPLSPLSGDFTATETSPLVFSVAATASGATGNYAYAWDFGDGQVGNGQNAAVTYGAGGNYTITLTLSDSGTGESVVIPKEVTATAPLSPLSGDFTATETSPLVFSVSATASGASGNYAYAWDFGDGQVGNGQNAAVTYGAGGTYTITLTLSDSGTGESVVIPKEVTATAPLSPLSGDFTATETSPLVFSVSATASGASGNYAYAWDFGDGQVGNGQNAAVTYGAGGTYTITLTLSDSGTGESVVIPKEVTATTPLSPLSGDFTATETSPLVFSVSATASGASGNYAYAWDFGDGQVGNGQNAAVTYGAGGTYTITLTLSDSGTGESVVIPKEVTATAPLSPLSGDFTATETSPLVFSVQATASGATGNYAYAWDFGDGQVGNGQNAAVTYGAGGTYTITLTLSDSGTGESVVIPKEVTATAPLAPLSGDFTATETSPLVFSVQATASGASGNYAYGWDFGDGQIGNGQNAAVTYGAGGTYTITLTLSDSGTGESVVIPKEVTATAPLAPLSGDFTATETSPLVFSVQATASGASGNYAYGWDFGDGQIGNGQNAAVTYGAGGTYTITLTLSDSGTGESVVIPKEVTATAPLAPLSGDFTATETSPLVFSVAATASGATGNYAYAWDFGDGQVGTGQNAAVTYGAGGTYTITLTLSDSGTGENIVIPKEVTATQAAPPLSGDFTAIETSPLMFSVQATASGASGNYAYGWDFGDGQIGNGQNATVTYGAGGTYTITLTVSDSGTGESVVIPKDVTATPAAAPLTGDFTATETSPLVFSVAATASGGSGGFAYAWDFGDGNGVVAAGETSSVTYGASGTYTITLSITDNQSAEVIQVTKDVVASQPSQTEVTEIIPNLAPIAPQIDAIYETGLSASRNNQAFAVIGDQTANTSNFLDPFGAAGTYTLDPSVANLQQLIDFYSTELPVGGNSFNRNSVAAEDGLTVAEAINDAATDPQCQPGETRLVCEIRVMNPSVAIVSIGYQDIVEGTDPAQFETNFSQLLQQITAANVVPIVTTTYTFADTGLQQQALQINDAIISAAEANNVPVLNQWRAFTELPGGGLDGGGSPTIAPQGPGFLSDGVTAGVNIRNLYILGVLNVVMQELNN